MMETTTIPMDAVGFDFGTTNSSVALVNPDSQVQLASFTSLGTEVESYRSVLYLEQFKTIAGPRKTHALTGPAAIEHYLQAEEKGRLISVCSNRICPAARSLEPKSLAAATSWKT